MNAQLVSKLILGAAQFGLDYGISNNAGKPSADNVYSTLDYALEQGIRFIDSANGYGNSLEVLSDYDRKSDLKFYSKYSCEEKNAIESLKESLIRLKVDSIFGFYAHSFEDLVNTEKRDIDYISERVEQFGVSVYGNDQLEKALEHEKVQIIQIPFNLLDNYKRRGELLRKANDLGKKVFTRSAFLQGVFFLDENQLKTKKLDCFSKVVKQLRLIETDTAKLALNYVMAYEHLFSGVIVGVNSRQELEQNIKNLTTLDENIISRVETLEFSDEQMLFPYNWENV